ncbi:LysR family transcriptional regulator [uncultured Amnibacterium sp.]|uniref:LysR family transcriptional regulator n=1 Tax=uncultured Amnibacterium sp. TaxID=1631851 RepID=UPI0035CB9DDE
MDVPIAMLQYFCVLADELHFGRAASRLGIASPSLSQQIARLEDRLGARLLDRGPRRVAMTDAGAQLLPLAREAVRTHRLVLDWAVDRRTASGPALRVGLVATGAGPLTTTILGAVLDRMPSVRLEMRRLGFFDVAEALTSGAVDVAFAPAPLPLPPEVHARELTREARVLVVPRGHPLAGRTEVGIAETDDEVFVAPASGDAAALDWWLVDPRPSGRRPRRGPSADDIEGILELVAAEVGVNIAAASVAAHYPRPGLAFVPIRDVPPASILLCRRAADDRPVVAAFERAAFEVAAHAG